MISCRDLIEQFLVDYFEAGLTEIQTEDFQRHLSVCASCRAYLATIEKTIAAAHALREEDADDAPEELIRAIVELRRR